MNFRTTAAVSILSLFLFLLPLPMVVHSAELAPGVRTEIDHLLSYMGKPGCQFYRNGTWYTDPKAVREHVETKYRYFMNKGRINSAEDFIKWSATKSELSGKPYLVKCDAGPERELSQWLIDELNQFRKANPAAPR
jgi:hypothetical protein